MRQGSPDETDALRAEVRNLRAQIRTTKVISRALGMLQERYRPVDERAAFELLSRASQNRNIKLRDLASALVAAPPPPTAGREAWFPGRVPRRAPRLAFLPDGSHSRATREQVVKAMQRRMLEVAQTPMGNTQLVDPASGCLQIVEHAGLSEEFVDFFQQVGENGTACAKAAQETKRVSVEDVATDPTFTEPARRQILAAGSRSCHSTPLLSASGRCLGITSSHHERPAHRLTAAQERELDALADQTGRWLQWHAQTVVLDALEHLHALARDARAGAPPGRA